MDRKRLIYFSSISGVGARQYLDSLRQHIGEGECDYELLDNHLLSKLGYSAWYEAHEARTPNQCQQAWADTFKEIVSRPMAQSLLIHSHTVHYNDDQQVYFPAYDPKAFQFLQGADSPYQICAVISLCDDVFETLTENRWKGQWNWIKDAQTRDNQIARYCDAVDTVLLWRRLDFFTSMTLAHLLDVPFYLLAVRHSPRFISRALKQLLDGKAPTTYYLSHNIRAVRSLKEWKGEAQLINYAAESLQDHSNIFIFEPTTIDEHITSSNEFQERWPREYEGRSFLYKSSITECLNSFEDNPNGDNTLQLKAAHKGLLEKMSNIDRDVTWRDLQLVYQSNGILMWRPFWRGNFSNGAQRELQVFSGRSDDRRKPAILVHQQGDIRTWGLDVLRKSIGDRIREGRNLNDAAQLIEQGAIRAEINWEMVEAKIVENISGGTQDRTILGSGGAGEQPEESRRRIAREAIQRLQAQYSIFSSMEKLREEGLLKQFVFDDLDSNAAIRGVVLEELVPSFRGE
jgi:hypothetical protein